MPWCEPCEKWRAPNALMPDGTCPRCRSQVEPKEVVEAAAAAAAAKGEAVRIPWHFWVMVAAAGLYLVWRAVQGISWLF